MLLVEAKGGSRASQNAILGMFLGCSWDDTGIRKLAEFLGGWGGVGGFVWLLVLFWFFFRTPLFLILICCPPSFVGDFRISGVQHSGCRPSGNAVLQTPLIQCRTR